MLSGVQAEEYRLGSTRREFSVPCMRAWCRQLHIWNEAQIMSADVMYNDPCRRFMTGFTIEKDQMRLWYFCRAHVLVSTFRPPQGTQTPHPFPRGKPGQQIAYEYKIEGRRFLTRGTPLSEDAAFQLVSRATRVWEVQEILPPPPGGSLDRLSAESYVLRDAWLYEDATLESDIHVKIRAKLVELDGENAKAGKRTQYSREAKHHLLTFVCDGWVTAEDLPPHDITAAPPGHPQAATFTTPGVPEKSLTQHHRRKHARTVFKETCESVYEIGDFKSLVSCLKDTVKVLNLMRLAGYVHRDVSAGNCLWIPPTDTVRPGVCETLRGDEWP
ncbi:hypothetical protein FA95DRAFT_935191 [Auriscalpium vulgare]|uniref:Uncharacterized protein n=1 Tax=Auriscalpium vulgare TaxID=40419 RepID=A0ACB8SAD3_9AGAM|nr:hypothetical protein FA95DRAFT_935191 [Auriscalpium vulgare]